MKKLYLGLIMVLSSITLLAQTNLSPGDIAIIGVNCDTPDEFSFVSFVELSAGTEIIFTDNGVFGGALGSNEGTTVYTAPSTITAGTVINYNAESLSTDFSSNSLGLATSGDQVIAYQNASSPVFLFAVNLNSSEFQVGISYDSNQSELPPGLTEGINAVAVGAGSGAEDEYDNSTYNETLLSGTKEELLAAICNPSNWIGSNTLITPLADGPFTVTPPSSPTIQISGSLAAFEATEGSASSSQSFTVSGENLTNDISVSAPTGFEVSLNDSDFSSSVTLTQSNGDLTGEPVSVHARVSSTASPGSISGIIALSSDGAADKSISVSAFIVASSGVATPYDQSFNSNPSDWYVYSVASSGKWTYDPDGYFEANAFNDDAPAEDWLISPKISMSGSTGMSISFESWRQYDDSGETTPLKVYYSTDYAGIGDPSVANWNEVTSLATFDPDGDYSSNATFSGYIDMSQERDDFYVGFVYKSSGTAGGTTSRIRFSEFSAGDLTTWNGTAWSKGAPDMDTYASVDGAFSTSTNGNLEARDLFVSASGTLTVPAGSYAKAHKEMVNNGTVHINSGGSLIIMESASGAGTGTYTIDKSTPFSTSEGKYSVIGSPVAGATTDALGSIVYSYDESTAYGTDGSARFMEVTSAETMSAGDAYFSANTGDISFTGIPNTGTISQTLVYDESNDGSAANAGYNLISNPYTAAIDADAFITANAATIGGSIYLWDDGGSMTGQRDNNDYIVYNSSTGMATRTTSGGREGSFDKYIRSAQGFFVKATAAGSVDFTPALMSTGNNSDAGYFREGSNNVIRVSISDSELYSDMLISMRDGATVGIDAMYDSYKPTGSKGLQLYSMIEGAAFAVQGLPVDGIEHSLDIRFNADAAGAYTIKLEEGAFENYEIYLIDRQLDKVIDMNVMSAYSFNSGIVKNSDRFQLLLSPAAILGFETGRDFVAFANDGSLNIRSTEMKGMAQIKVFSLNGRMISNSSANMKTGEASLPFNHKGLFIVTVESGNKTMVQKIIAQ